MNWTSNEIQYLLICSPCWSDYELDNSIINNFLNKDTAEQAIQVFDEMLNSSADR